MKNKKWKVFIVAHNRVYDWMYQEDKGFSRRNYTVLNVGSGSLDAGCRYTLVHQRELPRFTELGKWWAESEGIYNVWRAGLHKDLEYIGFIHYDKELRLARKPLLPWGSDTNITERVDWYVSKGGRVHISFETHDPDVDYRQKILADESKPNTLQGDGVNCYDYILSDYNSFFGARRTVVEFRRRAAINLCACFLIDVPAFEKMMGFWDWVVASGKLNIFDTEHNYRLQGGLAERYFGVFLMFEYSKMKDLSLVHHHNRGIK